MRNSYSVYWEARAKQSFWITQQIGSRMGAVLAMLAERLGLSPNVVSLLSFAVAFFGVIWVAFLPVYSGVGALVLFLTLHLAYGLDCADGQLARVTKRGSLFGQLLDKVIDQAASIWVPSVLAATAFRSGATVFPETALIGTLGLLLMARSSLSVTIWLKEGTMYNTDRLRQDDRAKSLGWYIRKLIGNLMDEITYRSALAAAWFMGWFWQFILIVGLLTLGVLLMYLLSTFREMSAFEKRSASKKSTL